MKKMIRMQVAINMKSFIVSLLIILFNIIDGIVTCNIVSNYNQELNPIISFYMEKLGLWFLVPKFIIGIIAGVIIYIYWDKFMVARIGGIIVLIVYSLLTVYHLIGNVLIYTGYTFDKFII